MSRTILIDWGTSNFRAYLSDDAGNVVERREAPRGILAIENREFERAALAEIGPWLQREVKATVLMAGMIGSRQGWVEAPYVECPAAMADVAANMVGAGETGRFVIAPGVSRRSKSGHCDVMRGEETQIFGAVRILRAEGESGDGVFCLPGTHSKWANIEAGRIVDFSTAMTGEMFALLVQHSILGRLMRADDPEDIAAFDRGLACAEEEGGLLSHLFTARADALLGEIEEKSARSYLSGILIGHELRDQVARLKGASKVVLIGAKTLCERYRRALDRLRFAARVIEAEAATIAGLLGLNGERRRGKEENA